MSHAPISIKFHPRQIMRMKKGQPVQIKPENIGHPHGVVFHYMHPATFRRLERASRQRKGVRLQFHPTELEGTGILDTLKTIGSTVLDIAAPMAAAAYPAYGPAIMTARQGFKAATGVGIKQKKGKMVKGSPEAKAHMARIRAMRKGEQLDPRGEGFMDFARKVGNVAKRGYTIAKEQGLLTKAADLIEKKAASKYPKYAEEAHIARSQVRKHLGFGMKGPLFQYGQTGNGIIPAGYSGF